MNELTGTYMTDEGRTWPEHCSTYARSHRERTHTHTEHTHTHTQHVMLSLQHTKPATTQVNTPRKNKLFIENKCHTHTKTCKRTM